MNFVKVRNGYLNVNCIVSLWQGSNKTVTVITDVTGETHTYDGDIESLKKLLED